MKKLHVFVKHYYPGSNKVRKSYFSMKGQSEDHKVIGLDVIWKGIISWVCMPNMKSLSLMVQNL